MLKCAKLWLDRAPTVRSDCHSIKIYFKQEKNIDVKDTPGLKG